MSKRSLTLDIQAFRNHLKLLSVLCGKTNLLIEQISVDISRKTSRGITRRRTLKFTRPRQIALNLQGQYMGRLRGLSLRNQSKVKKMYAEKGVKAAIRLAKKLLGDQVSREHSAVLRRKK